MKIYLELPFTNTLYEDDNNLYSANLTDDYSEFFQETRRYKFKRHDITSFKHPFFKQSITFCRWIYTIIDPKTFVLN